VLLFCHLFWLDLSATISFTAAIDLLLQMQHNIWPWESTRERKHISKSFLSLFQLMFQSFFSRYFSILSFFSSLYQLLSPLLYLSFFLPFVLVVVLVVIVFVLLALCFGHSFSRCFSCFCHPTSQFQLFYCFIVWLFVCGITTLRTSISKQFRLVRTQMPRLKRRKCWKITKFLF